MNILIPTYESVRKEYTAEQILSYFKIPISSSRKAVCPFHTGDTDPSLHVYDKAVHCYGCGKHLDLFDLAKSLLELRTGTEFSAGKVFAWFADTELPTQILPLEGKKPGYLGPASMELVDEWHGKLTEDHYAQLLEERLLIKKTVDRFKLGWRPVWEAWVLPFIINGQAETVQFRNTRPDSKTKYVGLEGHNRGSVMNADILERELPYVVILFGSFDSLLAQQDGIFAVGTNGSNPFKKEDHERLKHLFRLQKNIFIVPDNTPQEFKCAYQLADELGAQVRFFSDVPDGTDYIDYRKLGHTPLEFMSEVLKIDPLTVIPDGLLDAVWQLALVGDPFDLIPVYLFYMGRGIVVADLAQALANFPKPDTINDEQWKNLGENLSNVGNLEGLLEVLSTVQEAVRISNGGW